MTNIKIGLSLSEYDMMVLLQLQRAMPAETRISVIRAALAALASSRGIQLPARPGRPKRYEKRTS